MRILRPLLLLTLLALAATPAVAANDFCTDCTMRQVREAWTGEVVMDAECCIAWNGHCYSGDYLADENVGVGCIIIQDDETGDQSCDRNGLPSGCEESGGSGGGGWDVAMGDDQDTGDCSNGWGACPPWCSGPCG